MKKVALFLSVLFHPVFVNLYALISLLYLNPFLAAALPFNLKLFYVALIFVSTGLVPLIFVAVRYLLGYADSFMLNQADERQTPYLITACCYLITFYLLAKINAPKSIQAFLLAGSTTMVAVLGINFFSKISAHTTSLGSLLGLLIALSSYQTNDMRLMLALVLIISGLVASSRLVLKAHSQKEIYTGFILGAILMWLIL